MKKNSTKILILGICSAFLVSACVDKLAVGDAFLVWLLAFGYTDVKESALADVKKSLNLEAEESLVKISCTGKETLAEIREKINAAIEEDARPDANNGTEQLAKLLTFTPNFVIKLLIGTIKFLDRHGMLPKAIIGLSPFHTSAFVTNLKSIKGPAIFHHLYDFGTNGLFIAMGKESPEPVVSGGSVDKGKLMPLNFTLDERFCDGLYWVTSLRALRALLINPHQLMTPYQGSI